MNVSEEYDESEESSVDGIQSAVMPPSDIVTFNEMRSCSDLARLSEKGVLEIRPDFQRGVVWSRRDRSLFIDSLMKQLPIPSICISLDASTGRRQVIDGLQRLSAIISFINYTSDDWVLVDTKEIDPRIAGKRVSEIYKTEPRLAQIVEDTILPINVVRCDSTKKSHREYLFQIFSRLNSGGKRLRYQEIRNCVYQGQFNTFLKAYVRTQVWKDFADVDDAKIEADRFSHEERVLRFFAFMNCWEKYSSGLAGFLNEYMDENKDISELRLQEMKEMLDKAISHVMSIEGKKATRKNWNLIEDVLIGIGKNIHHIETLTADAITSRYQWLVEQPAYGVEMKEGVLGATKVKTRIKLAIKAFSNEPLV